MLKDLLDGKIRIVVDENIGHKSVKKIGEKNHTIKFRDHGAIITVRFKNFAISLGLHNFRDEDTLLNKLHSIIGNRPIYNGELETKFRIEGD